jgi:GNAT superfamily N-acetyltransferase
MPSNITIHPLKPDRWADLETLFGPSGADGGCWCMWFRLRRSEMARSTNAKNKAALKRIVGSGHPPGLIAYVDGKPAGWVSLDPRERYAMLMHGRIWKPLDDTPVWSIVCFVVGKPYRRQGVMSRPLDAAVDYARDHGAETLEAYPVDATEELTGYDGFTGIASVFKRAGFREAGRMSNGRPVVRLEVS